MSAREYLATCRRWWWLLLVCTVVSGGVAWFVSASRPVEYVAEAGILVQPPNRADYSAVLGSQQVAKAVASLARSDAVISDALGQLGPRPPLSTAQVAQRLTVDNQRETQWISVRVRLDEPALAANLANAIAEAALRAYSAGSSSTLGASRAFVERELARLEGEIDRVQAAPQPQPAQAGEPPVARAGELAAQIDGLQQARTSLSVAIGALDAGGAARDAARGFLERELARLDGEIAALRRQQARLGAPTATAEATAEAGNALPVADAASRAAQLRTLRETYTGYLTYVSQASFGDVRLVMPATPPAGTAGLRPPVAAGAGAAAGLALALLLAALLQRADTVVRTPAQVQAAIGARAAASTPAAQRPRPGRGLVTHAEPAELNGHHGWTGTGRFSREAMAATWLVETNPTEVDLLPLATTLRQSFPPDRSPGAVLVTSPHRREGKSTVSAQLAKALVRLGESVILIDANAGEASLRGIVGPEARHGVLDILQATIEGITCDAGAPPLALLSLKLAEDAGATLGNSLLGDILERLGRDRFVIVDGPPLLDCAPAVLLLDQVSRVLIVADGSQTRAASLRRTVELVRTMGADLVGIVLNRAAVAA